MNGVGFLALLGAICAADYNNRRIIELPEIFICDELPGNMNAICFPPVGIFVTREQADNWNLIEHEIVHWQQYQELGLLPFYLKYAGQFCFVGYDQMSMEVEARFNECEYCKTHYRECVRNGTAKTVCNPDFFTGTNFLQDLPSGPGLETNIVPQ